MKKLILLLVFIVSSYLLIYAEKPVSIRLSSYQYFEKNIVNVGRKFSREILTVPNFGRSYFQYSFEQRLYVLIEDQFRSDVKKVIGKVNWSKNDTLELRINSQSSRYYEVQQKLYEKMLYLYIKNSFYGGAYHKDYVMPIADSWIEIFNKKRIVKLN